MQNLANADISVCICVNPQYHSHRVRQVTASEFQNRPIMRPKDKTKKVEVPYFNQSKIMDKHNSCYHQVDEVLNFCCNSIFQENFVDLIH